MKASWYTKHDGPTAAIIGEREYPEGTATRYQIVNMVALRRLPRDEQAMVLKGLVDRINYELDAIAAKAGVK